MGDTTRDGRDDRRRLDRRSVLAAPLALGATLAVRVPVAAEDSMSDRAFHHLAVFLTGKPDLSPALVRRARGALDAADAGIGARIATLARAIAAARPPDVEAFRASPLADDPNLMATAVEVVRAFYTGRVGRDYKGHLVSYEEALMYRPTLDVTVIPTYARAGPAYWAEATPP